MSENGEIYTAGKNFTLPPALTALTNSNSVLRYLPGDKLQCNVLVSGVGFLHVPKMPDIPGMEDFQV